MRAPMALSEGARAPPVPSQGTQALSFTDEEIFFLHDSRRGRSAPPPCWLAARFEALLCEDRALEEHWQHWVAHCGLRGGSDVCGLRGGSDDPEMHSLDFLQRFLGHMQATARVCISLRVVLAYWPSWEAFCAELGVPANVLGKTPGFSQRFLAQHVPDWLASWALALTTGSEPGSARATRSRSPRH